VITGGAAGPSEAFCSGADLAPPSSDESQEKSTSAVLDDTDWIGQFHLECGCFSIAYELAAASAAAVTDTKKPTARARGSLFKSISYRQMCLESREGLSLNLANRAWRGPLKAHLGRSHSAEGPLAHPRCRARPKLGRCAPLRQPPFQTIPRDSLGKRSQPRCSAFRSRSAKAC
jgi:hypothetical protein